MMIRSAIAVMTALLALAASVAAGQQPSGTTSTQAETVVVEVSKLPVQTFIDRRVYTLTDNLLTSFGTVSDVLADIPSVNVDSNGGITLRGDSSVLILIDGKPSTLFSGANPGAALQSLPAASIDRIEVLTTPPPQYQAAGAAGVINLVTRPRRATRDSVAARASLGNEGRAMGGADLRRSFGRWDLSASIGLRHDSRRKLLESDMRSPLEPSSSTLATRSALLEYNRSEVRSARLNADYRASERDSLSGSFSYLSAGGPRTYHQTTTTTESGGRVAGTSDRLSEGHDPEETNDGQLAWVRKLQGEGETLSFSVQRGTSHKRTGYDYTISALIPAAPRATRFLILDERRTHSAISTDYVLPQTNDREWKLGYVLEEGESGFESTYGAGTLAGPIGGSPAGFDQFRYRDWIHAAYVSYRADWNGWAALVGVRLEDTTTETRAAPGTPSRRDHYVGAFPSLNLEHQLTDKTILHVSVGRRLSRPAPQQLNPNVNQEYTLIQRAGNPLLRPEYTQTYEAGVGGLLSQDFNFQVTGYLRRNRDSAIGVVNYLGNGIALSTQENLRRDDYSGIEVSADGRLGSHISFSVSADAFRGEVQSIALGDPALRSSTGLNAKLKLSYRPTPFDSSQLTISHVDGRVTAQGYERAMTVVNLGYRRQLRPKLYALATVSNVFDGQRTESVASTSLFSGALVRAVYGPIIYVGLDWSSGTQRKSEPDFDYQK